MGSSGYRSGWRHGGEVCQASEVLDGGGQEELVPCPGEASEPEPGETEVPFQVAEAGFDFLALASGLDEGFAPHECSSMIAGRLVNVALDTPRR